MSSLKGGERRVLEEMLGMGSGYVSDFSDRTFEEFLDESIGIEVYTEKYGFNGGSKAKHLRAVWEVEPDHVVGKLITEMIQFDLDSRNKITPEIQKSAERCREIAERLLNGGPKLTDLKEHAAVFDSRHMNEQIRRMETAVNDDPSLAIGTAKELIETCCKTILAERNVDIPKNPDIAKLTKTTLKELNLVPDGISDETRGADTIKRLLSNLGAIGNGLAELRGMYGTGHGKHGNTSGLKPRHAKLAVGAASTLCVFLFETHEDTKS